MNDVKMRKQGIGGIDSDEVIKKYSKGGKRGLAPV